MKKLSYEQIQKRILNLMTVFASFCDSNNLAYFISSGTCLGAIRHHGFIPWDNDADFMMPRSDYERLIELLKSQNDIFFMTYDTNKSYYYPFAKIYDPQTILVEQEMKQIKELGLYIDIFPVDGVPNNLADFNKSYETIKRLKKLLSRKNSRRSKLVKSILCKLTTLFVSTRSLCKRINDISKKNAIGDCDNVMDMVWGTKPFSKSVLASFVDADFEGRLFKVPKEYDSYLKSVYGNYRVLPPKEKQVSHDMIVYLKE